MCLSLMSHKLVFEKMKEQGNATENLSYPCFLDYSFSNTEVIAQVSALSMVLVLSLVGNLLVIYCVLRNDQLRCGNNLFFLNMAISDLLVPLMILPRVIVVTYTQKGTWPFTDIWGDITCKIFWFLQDISASVSVLTLICMTIDRFCAIVFPTKIKLISDKSRLFMIVSTWIISSATSSTYLVTMNALKDKHGNNFCSLKWPKGSLENSSKIVIMFNLIFYFLMPMALLITLYGIILTKLKAKIPIHSSAMAKKRMQIARRVTIMTIVVVGLFGIFWGPNFLFHIVLAFYWNWRPPPSLCSWQSIVFVLRYLSFAHAAVNPFVCFVFTTKFRKAFKDTLKTTQEGTESNNLNTKSVVREEKVSMLLAKTALVVRYDSRLLDSIK